MTSEQATGRHEKDKELEDLRKKLADSEEALAKERARVQRLQAESLYMRTAISKYRPSGSLTHLHPSATACTSQTHATSHASIACQVKEDDNTVTVSKEAFELLQLKDRAMDSIKEGITIADCSLPDMPLIYANQGFVQITGCPVADVLGKNCRFLQGIGSEEESVRILREASALGEAAQVTLTNYRRNGDAFVNYLSITPVHNNMGQLTHYVGVQSDITELVQHKKAELAAKHQAVQAEAATEAKSQFLARMSHEIRTPLNGMIAVGQLLAETNLTASQRDLVNTIRCSGETLLILITDILDFSRIEANKMVLSLHHFKLRTVLESAMEIAGLSAAQKRVQVAYHIAEDVPENLLGDAQRLQQILLNVLNNAVKFTEKGEVLCEVWMGGTEPSLLNDTGYPLQAVEGVLDGKMIGSSLRDTIDTAGMHDVPTSGQSNSNGSEDAPSPGESGVLNGDHSVSHSAEEKKHSQPESPSKENSEPHCGQKVGEDLPEGGQSSKESGKTACGRPLLLNPGNPRMTHTIHFAIRDTGIGISQDNLGKLFKLFSQVDSSRTRQHGGSGLGLAICKRLVEAMGGSMWATSPGKKQGSTFRFSIRCPMDSTTDTNTSASSSTASSLGSELSTGAEDGPRSSQDSQGVCEAELANGVHRQSSDSSEAAIPHTPFMEAAQKSDGPCVRPSSMRQASQENPQSMKENPKARPKSSKKKNIRELRQVLTDILPGGSETPSVSGRTSDDAPKNSGEMARRSTGPVDGQADAPRRCSLDRPRLAAASLEPHISEGASLNGHDDDDGDASGVDEFLELDDSDDTSARRDVTDLSRGLTGKKVLLVEQNSVVRHCMLTYLQQLGMEVRACGSEDQAVACLRLQGALTRKTSSEQIANTDSSHTDGSLKLEHAQPLAEIETLAHGPFDVVVTDVAQTSVLHALIQAAPSEAQRLVFMSWPGERDLDKDLKFPSGGSQIAGSLMDPRSLFPTQQVTSRTPPQPPKAFREEMKHRTTTRQLGYVTIFRPIRQERLKMAIEEVLRTTLNPNSARSGALLEVMSSSQLSQGSEAEASRQPSSSHTFLRSANSSSSSSLQSHMTIPRNLRVLLAEDNIINLKVALGILQRIGFKEVVCAADGVNALSEMTMRGGGDAFDIVLTDLHMPRKGGMELVKEIRETWPDSNVKVVAVTADAFDDTRDLCLSAGFDAWLAKPFRIQDLAKVIDLVLSLRSPFKSPA